MGSVKKNTRMLSEAANLLLRANTKFLQGDIVSCEKLADTALHVVKGMKREDELASDIRFIEKQLNVLRQLLVSQKNGRSTIEKCALPLKIEAQVNLLRACISRGNIKAAMEGLNRLLFTLPPEWRFHSDILDIEAILQKKNP